jgi:hypothetical protein
VFALLSTLKRFVHSRIVRVFALLSTQNRFVHLRIVGLQSDTVALPLERIKVQLRSPICCYVRCTRGIVHDPHYRFLTRLRRHRCYRPQMNSAMGAGRLLVYFSFQDQFR